MRNFFLKGLAALTMGFAMTACTQDFNYEEQEQQASLNNAQQTLGFYIPDNQDWVMSTTATATFNIKGLSDEATVYVFSNNPQADGYGSVLASGQTTGTTTTLSEFSIPAHLESVFVGVKESNGNMIYKYVNVENGQINADYDFSTTANARTRSITVNGDTYSAFNFPSSSDLEAAFPTSIPTDADEVADLESLYKGKTIQTQYGTTTMSDLYAIYLNKITKDYNLKITKTGTIDVGGCQNGADKLYNVFVSVDGNVTIKRPQNAFYRLYILKGNVTLDANFGEMAGVISIGEGATLNDPRTHIAANDGIKVYNKGTYNVTNTNDYWNGKANVKFDIGNNASLYNEGKFTVKNGGMSYSAGAGNTSYFINMGDDAYLEASSMTLNSTCHFYNSGTVSISGETFVTQQGITWINNGHYTTGSMTFSAKNSTFYNYCQLLVTGNAHMYDGEFNLMNGSYTEAATAEFDNFIVNMGGNSGFNVLGNNTWAAQGDGTFQGFKATGTNNYVRLGGNTTVAGHLKSLETSGTITLAYNNIIDQGAGNSGVQPTYQFNEGTTKVKFSELNPTYNTTNCGASWNGDPSIDEPITENQTWTYAFEDNKTRCDFDLNDVVIQVRESEANANKLIIKLVAAGCQYDNYVWLGNTQLSWNGNAEVHDAFGVTRGVMVNTGRGEDTGVVETTIDKPSGFSFQTANFKIRPFKVNSDPTISTNAVSDYITVVTSKSAGDLGQAPLGLAIPAKWKWPKERVIVNEAYSGFTAWGRQTDLTLRAGESGWYQTSISGQVYGE